MRRLVGIIIFVLGVLLLAGGIKFQSVRPLIGTGVFAIVIGLAVFGLSFLRRAELEPDAPPPLSAAERITAVFYEPARVFQNLRYHPRWVAAFLVMVLVSLTYQIAFTQRMTPEAIASATADKAIESGWIPEDRQAQYKQQTVEAAKSPAGRIGNLLNQVGGTFIFMMLLAGLFLLLVLIFGGRMGFFQALSVAVYSSLPPAVIQSLLGILLLYLKAPEDIDPIKGQRGMVHADLGLLFSAADHPYLYTLGSMIGVFTLYWLWLLATGLRHTGQKVSAGSAWAIALLLWGIGILLALGAAALFPSFVA